MRHPSNIRALPPDTGLVADPNEDAYTPMQPEGEGPGPGDMQDIQYVEPPWGRDEEMPEGEPGEWPEDEQELQRGGMVRPRMSRRRRRRLRGRRPVVVVRRPRQRGPMVRGNRENVLMRRMVRAPRTGYRKGYAAGGPVGYDVSGPVKMSVALDSREKSGDHWAEDATPLATRPPDAPEAPTEGGGEGEGYRRGGIVRGYQEGGDVEDDIDYGNMPYGDVDYGDDEEPEFEPPPEEEQDQYEEPPPEEMPRDLRDLENEPPPEEEPSPDEEGGDGGPQGGGGQQQPQEEEAPPEEEGGGAGAPTGYNAPPADQGDRDPAALQEQEQAAQQGTGYQPTLADRIREDPGSVLKDVMDWTQKQFGIGAEAKTPPQPGAPAEGETAPPAGIGAPPATPQVALPPPPVAGERTGEEAEQPPTGKLAAAGPNAPMPTPEQKPTVPAQQRDQRAEPGQASQGLKDYLEGKRSFTPEQMTQLLDKATQENPNLDQGGAIRKAFGDLVQKGDMDGASRFVQSLRPSYDNLRAAMIAATSKGDFAGALQIAERMNNLIPNGKAVQFTATEDGRIMATVRPDGGGPAQTYSISPQQFARYAAGAGSVFDVTASQGIERTLGGTPIEPRQLSPETMTAATALGTRAAGQFAPGQVAGPGAPTDQTPLPRPRPEAADIGRPAVGDTARPPVSEIRRPAGAGGQPRTGYQQAGTPMPRERPAEAGPAARTEQRVDTQGRPIGPPAVTTPQTGYQGGQRTVDQQQQQQQRPLMREGPASADRRQWQNQRPGDVLTGRSNKAASGVYDIQRPTADQRAWKYGRDVRDPDGWPTGIPRGGQFLGRYYDVGGHTYDVDRRGMPLAQQGQPGWHGPLQGQPGWNGTPGTINPPERYLTGPSARNAPGVVEGIQQRAAEREAQQNQPQQRQAPPTTEGQGPPKAGQQQQQPPNQQQQQRQTDPNIRPDGSRRNPGDPYFGNRAQQQQQYNSDLRDHDLKMRAWNAYPYDSDKQQREYNRLKEQDARQTRHEQRQDLDQRKLDAQNTRARQVQDGLNNRALMTHLTQMGMQRERLAFQDLQNRVKAEEAKNKDNPDYKYPYTDQDKQLLQKLYKTAVENDLYEQMRPQVRPVAPNTTTQPQAPVAPRGQTTAPNAPAATPNAPATPNVDLKTYRGDREPYAAPQGQEWRRSKNTGEWRLFPIEQRPTVPMSQ